MSASISIVKRLRIFVSHPHVEWHETSSALGEDAFREINEARRKKQLKAKNARERQNELQELRKALSTPTKTRQTQAKKSGSDASKLGSIAATQANDDAQDKAPQAFMSTMDAAPMIGEPLHVHTDGFQIDEAFASTAADSTLYDKANAAALRPRHTRISGVAPGVTNQQPAPTAANDQSRVSFPESILAAAVSLAVGDKSSARNQLKTAFAQSPNKRVFAQAWLECLRACDEQEAYAAAATALSELHGFQVPAFFSASTANLSSGPQVVAKHVVADRLTLSAELNAMMAEDLLSFVQHLHTKNLPAAIEDEPEEVAGVLSFVALKQVRPEAESSLLSALKLINDSSSPFVLQGGTVLLEVLLGAFSAQQSLPSKTLWEAALEACRLMGRADRYESLKDSYYSLYYPIGEHKIGDSKVYSDQYVWKPTQAHYVTFHRAVNDAAELAFSIEATSASRSVDAAAPSYTPFAQSSNASAHVQALRITGQGTHERVSRVMELADSLPKGHTALEIDLSRTVYLHFDAAVSLLNWCQHKREQGISVTLKGQGLLIQALFEQISMADVAALHPQYF